MLAAEARVGTDGRIRQLVPALQRYRDAPNIIFGQPQVLRELCRCLGFQSQCSRGRLFLTDGKIQKLEGLGLGRGTEGLPPGITDVLASLEAAHAQEKVDRQAFFEPPAGDYVGVDQMPARARAYACLLALKAGFRIDRRDWSYCSENDNIVVDVPRVGRTWSVVRYGRDEVVAAIGTRWGELTRQRAEEAIGP